MKAVVNRRSDTMQVRLQLGISVRERSLLASTASSRSCDRPGRSGENWRRQEVIGLAALEQLERRGEMDLPTQRVETPSGSSLEGAEDPVACTRVELGTLTALALMNQPGARRDLERSAAASPPGRGSSVGRADARLQGRASLGAGFSATAMHDAAGDECGIAFLGKRT